jgi:hypothetical protein
MKRTIFDLRFAFYAMAVVLPMLVMGQETNQVAAAAAPAAAKSVNLTYWLILLVPAAIAGLKLALGEDKIPKWILPILAPVLGLVSGWLASLAGANTDPLVGAVAGAAGVGLREVIDQASKRVVNGVAQLLIGAGIAGALLCGCSTTQLDPNADPFVVQIERVETSAKATFDAVLKLDDSARPWWIANAPGFHVFCEKLREPTAIQPLLLVDGTPVPSDKLPLNRAVIWSLDNVKLGYKAGVKTSNDLDAAYSTLAALLTQANGWAMVVTNSTR